MRIAAPILDPVWLIELRVLLSALTILLLSIQLNIVLEIRDNLVSLFVLGCINLAIPFILFAIAALYLPAGFTAILNATAPLFGTVIAFLWLKEKLTWSGLGGLIVGFVGVTILVGRTDIPMTTSFVLSTVAGLLGTLMYAIAAPFAKDKLLGISLMAIAAGSSLGAAWVGFATFNTVFLTQVFYLFKSSRDSYGFSPVFYCSSLYSLFSFNQ